MTAGAVIVDMGASDLGGNVAGSVPGETVVTGNGITIIGASGNLPSTMSTAASSMYARNVSTLLQYLVKDGALAIDRDDELQAGVIITHDGQVVHPALTAAGAQNGSAAGNTTGGPGAPAAASAPAAPEGSAEPAGGSAMTSTLLTDLTIFILSLWVGFEVISKVPATLHTPLMSAANSIHGIVLAGAMLIAVTANNAVGYVIAFVAAAFAAMNVVGGYVVTGRMLKMFKRRPPRRPPELPRRRRPPAPPSGRGHRQRAAGVSAFSWVTQLLYVLSASCFVLGLHLMNNPATARRGNQVSTARHGRRDRRHPGHHHPRGRHQRDRLGRHDRRGAGRLRASACTPRGPCR